jgi:hypothetical protein
MSSVYNLLCVGLLCVMCYFKQLCCVCGQSCAWNQLMDVLNQLFVILHANVTNVWVFSLVPKYLCYLIDEFFVLWSLLLLSYQIYVLLTRENNHLTKIKKINLGHFLSHMLRDGLPVSVPISKPFRLVLVQPVFKIQICTGFWPVFSFFAVTGDTDS